jgi:hypothetical protein
MALALRAESPTLAGCDLSLPRSLGLALLALSLGASAACADALLAKSLGDFKVTTATAANTSGDFTDIENPLSNNDPNAIIFETPNFNPGGGAGTYNNHNEGVFYDVGTNRWSVFNQDLAAMPLGASFNVFIPATTASIFIQTSAAGNISGDATIIDNPLTNGNPNALLTITQNWNPGGSGGVYHNHAVGVYYTGSKWAIFNEDIAAMTANAAFNVLVASTNAHTFVQTATAGNIVSNWTVISNPLLDGRPDAVITATQNWNPGGGAGIYNNHPIGVWYDGSHWAVFNQDLAAMTTNAHFNISILRYRTDLAVHTATAGNTSGDYTLADLPSANGNQSAIVLATQNWNPGGAGGTYNNHEIGVWYSTSDSKWGPFNEDVATMSTGPSFDMLVTGPTTVSFLHTASPSNSSGDFTLIDNPATNGKPNAVVMVVPNWNPTSSSGVYSNHVEGVYYTGSQWAVFNQDLSGVPNGSSYNVLVLSTETNVFVHQATPSNIVSQWTEIDNPATNNNPSAVLMVTQNWNPGGSGGTYNNHRIGVYYTGSKWAIFNEDLVAMPSGASFNVLVGNARGALAVGPVTDQGHRVLLLQNHPNPFRGKTTFGFVLPEPSRVKLNVLDVAGRRMRTVVDERFGAGEHDSPFDARGLSSGVYFYELRVSDGLRGTSVERRKLLLMK